MLPNCTRLNEEIIRNETGDLIDLDGFIDKLPGKVEEAPVVEPWLPESSF